MSLPQALNAVRRKTDDIYAATLADSIEIVFRLPPIKKAEQYALLLRIAEDYSFQVIIYENIFTSCIEDNYMKENPDIHAGIVETIAKLVLYLSGVGESSIDYTEELFTLFRADTSKVLLFMQRTICSTFNGYTFEMLEELNYQRLVNIFIQAEQVLLDRGIIESVHQFNDPSNKKNDAVKSLHDQIRMDQRSFQEYDKPTGPDPRMEELRRQAKERAVEEESKYRERMGG